MTRGITSSSRLVALLAALCLTACPPPPPEPPKPVDGCELAGARLDALGCAERTTKLGTPFAVTCRDSAADGRPYPVDCIAHAASCEEAVACK
jgi:hypothetical protein